MKKTPHTPESSRRVSRRALLRSAGVAGVGALGMGLAGCRGRPDQDIVEFGTEPTQLQAGGTLTGRVVGLLGGAAVGGAAIRIVGVGEVKADSQGQFEVRIERRGDYDVVVTDRKHHKRAGRLRVAGNVNLNLTMLEDDGGLRMPFLDEYARGAGPRKEGVRPRTPGATNRWSRPPTVRIYRKLADDDKDVLPEARIAAMRGAIASLFGPLTGNALGGASIEVHESAPPADLGDVEAGVLAVVQRKDNLLGAEHTGSLTNPFEISKARIFCSSESRIELFNRMFAHALGAWSVGNSDDSIVNARGRATPSDADRLAASFLYRRTAGNTAPDRDPSGVFLNG